MLPPIKEVKPLPYFTPALWQTVLLRTYGLVSSSRIASVLKTSEEVIEREAKRLGIENIVFQPEFEKQGYITVIRSVWSVLPYEQIIDLLDTDEKTLDYNLKEDDFLDCKLGYFKPACPPVYYSPLTADEERETERCATVIRENFIPSYAPSFRFYDMANEFEGEQQEGFERVVYSYSLAYGDTFLEGADAIDEGLLKKMKAVGVNGVWMQGVLSALSPYPFAPDKSEGYELRRKNLKNIVEKCARYGIGVYLYMNEPRALAEDLFTAETESLKGGKEGNNYCLCTSKAEVKEYLYEAVKGLVSAVPELAGIITITMSENLTNCFSRGSQDCPVCNGRGRDVVVPEINNIFARAVRDGGAKTRVIANLWAWTEGKGFTAPVMERALKNLDDAVEVMSVSELGTVIKDGKAKTVAEYSLSQVGPCEETKKNLALAKSLGHKVWAKVQINNSWEFSTVPCIPVFELVLEHIEGLKRLDLSGLMMSWTLGGYPSVSCDLANEAFKEGFSYDEWLKKRFSVDADNVKKAVSLFSEGFRFYPYGWQMLYYGPQHIGATNPLYAERTEREATMVCYPYDDLKSWRGGYSEDEFIEMLVTLTKKWEEGIALLSGELLPQTAELKLNAQALCVSMKSALNQTRFILSDKSERKEIIEEEKRLTLEHYAIASRDCRIGYEASNHYFYTQNSFLEKLLNLETLKNL